MQVRRVHSGRMSTARVLLTPPRPAAAMILGLAVLPVCVLMALNMLGAWILVHHGGLYALDYTGPELVIALGLLSLVLAVSGAGRLGLDHLIVRLVRRRSSTA